MYVIEALTATGARFIARLMWNTDQVINIFLSIHVLLLNYKPCNKKSWKQTYFYTLNHNRRHLNVVVDHTWSLSRTLLGPLATCRWPQLAGTEGSARGVSRRTPSPFWHPLLPSWRISSWRSWSWFRYGQLYPLAGRSVGGWRGNVGEGTGRLSCYM